MRFAVFFEGHDNGNLRRGNVTILLAVMAVERYAFTSLGCAYAAVASVIILAYFWRGSGNRPFLYA